MNSHSKASIKRSFLMLVALVVVLSVLFVAGCKEQNALGTSKTGIPMPMVQNFVADSKVKVYHKLTCPYKPTKGDLVYFDSPVAAQEAKFRPCRECKPNMP